MATLRRLLVGRHWMLAVGKQLRGGEQPVPRAVGVEGGQQRRSFPHQAYPRVLLTMNPPLMPLGQPEPTLQIQVVPGHVARLATDKEPGLPAGHELAQMLVKGQRTLLQPLLQGRKLGTPLAQPAAARVERFGDQTNLRHLLLDDDAVLGYRRQPRVEPRRQPGQAFLRAPPFFAPRLRCRDCRTSVRASAIRSPGGWRGPP